MDKALLTIVIWLLFLSGLLCTVVALAKLISGPVFPDALVAAIAASLKFVFVSIAILVKSKIP